MVTMRPEDILELTEKPETISSASLQSLKQQINAYPWFTVAKLLYLKGLAHSDSDKYSSELRKMAISIPDRQRLFNLINSERFNLEEEESPTEETISDNSFSLIDSFLTEHKDEQSQATDEKILAHSSVSNDYMFWQLNQGTEKPAAENAEQTEDNTNDLQKLIDSFSDRPKAEVELPNAPEAASEEDSENSGKEIESVCFTETLAHIYIRQHRYEKALQIIKSLNLNNPEKNRYFADQIRFLEKLIINNNKK